MKNSATIQDLDVDLLKGNIEVRDPVSGVLVEYTDDLPEHHALEQPLREQGHHRARDERKDVKNMALVEDNCTDQSTQTDENWMELENRDFLELEICRVTNENRALKQENIALKREVEGLKLLLPLWNDFKSFGHALIMGSAATL